MARASGLQMPPQYTFNPAFQQKLRFTASANVSQVVTTLQRLLASIGGTLSAVNVLSINANAVRIRRIRVWGPPTAGTVIRAMWLPSTALFDRPRMHSDTCTSTAQPAYLDMTPPEGSLYDDWISANATATDTSIIEWTVPAGTVIDIDLAWSAFNGVDGSTRSTAAVVSAAAGSPFWLPLDGPITSGGKLVPSDLPSV